MKRAVFVGLAAASVVFPSPFTSAATWDDIEFWAGSGANQAALVIDWNDGKTAESLLWGYRWDGTATGMAMLQAVVSADPRLFAHIGNFGWGQAILGIGYDLNNNAVFGVSPALTFDSGGLLVSGTPTPDDSRSATESADHYLEGWNSGFWGYYTKPSGVDPWTEGMAGAADRVLSNGAWDGYSFAPGFSSSLPSDPLPVTTVPEPVFTPLILLCGLLLTCHRRAHR
jgi:hypothetical protein